MINYEKDSVVKFIPLLELVGEDRLNQIKALVDCGAMRPPPDCWTQAALITAMQERR